MVRLRSGAQPPAQSHGASEQAQRTPSGLDAALTLKAASALEEAGLMQPGGERAAAVRKATILTNAAEILRHFSTGSLRTK
ncbi:hypothetical protein SSBR45G_60680 [Bradyrhizobium sp. SSBR45G]|nr:hypothetical protein SSBR45G_60680 [Bradyrhizobium sp. SSBR45G]GLH88560.1 hypothetical protein SSBR45R_60210 [Bradyrhizobium sp. SSBR45R]